MWKKTIKRIFRWSPFPSLILMLFMLVLNVIFTPKFFNPLSLSGFFSTTTPIIIAAMGCAVALLGGVIDLSVGAIISLVNVVFIKFAVMGYDFILCAAIAIVCSLVIGAINGLVIGLIRVNSVITTFATYIMAAGLALWIFPTPGGSAPSWFINWYGGFFLGIPIPIYIILLTALIWLLIRYTPFGVSVYAVGKSEEKAYITGIPVARVKFFTCFFASFIYGIAGLSLCACVGAGDPLVGLNITLFAIAAGVIGGISLSGGEGSLVGAIFGAIFFSLVITLVLMAHIDPFYQDLVSALVILLGILGSTWLERKRKIISL